MGQTGRTLLGLVVVLAVIGGGIYLFRDRLTGAAEDLAVGDCFEVPNGDTVTEVQHRPCTEPHDGEVFVVANIDGATTYPSSTEFETWVQSNCLGTPFEGYVGTTFDAATTMDVQWFAPTRDGWDSGDREMACFLTPIDGQPVSTSYRAGAAPAAS